MLTLPEHLISPLVFIDVHVILSFVSCNCLVFLILSFEYIFILNQYLSYIYMYHLCFVHICIDTIYRQLKIKASFQGN